MWLISDIRSVVIAARAQLLQMVVYLSGSYNNAELNWASFVVPCMVSSYNPALHTHVTVAMLPPRRTRGKTISQQNCNKHSRRFNPPCPCRNLPISVTSSHYDRISCRDILTPPLRRCPKQIRLFQWCPSARSSHESCPSTRAEGAQDQSIPKLTSPKAPSHEGLHLLHKNQPRSTLKSVPLFEPLLDCLTFFLVRLRWGTQLSEWTLHVSLVGFRH